MGLGWSARELAEVCAQAGAPTLTRSTIAKIESGIRKSVTASEAAVLAKVLKASPAEMLGTDEGAHEVTVGIVTALPVEARAVLSVMDSVVDFRVADDPNHYRTGSLPSADAARPHRVALVVAPTDNAQSMAVMCANMLRSFPRLRLLIRVGIAGAVPSGPPERRARLGDVVVSTDGVVDLGRRLDDRAPGRRLAGSLASELTRASRELLPVSREHWKQWLPPESEQRPGSSAHPRSDQEFPQVHFGAIGNAEVLLHDAANREELAAEHGLMVIEMEAAAVAAAASQRGIGWFEVLGIVDFGDVSKGDVWHSYASVASAAFTRALLAAVPPHAAWHVPPSSRRTVAPSPDEQSSFRAAEHSRLLPGLIVQIEQDGIDRSRCRIQGWTSAGAGAWAPRPLEAVDVALSQVEREIERLVRVAEARWRDVVGEFTIEFLLPTGLIDFAVESIRIEQDSPVPLPLCLDYPVVVRSLERMRAAHRHRQWRQRWARLWDETSGHRTLVGPEPGEDLSIWAAQLRFPESVTCVVLTAPPSERHGNDQLQLAIAAGIPVIAWGRTDPATRELEELVSAPPVEIISRISQKRREAYLQTPVDRSSFQGSNIALLWDDPDHLVMA